ncbi:MAG TPA: hypothetical protein VMH23_08695 [Bacteroidota bacterium]|nr:hypothetical protein [Bacteroidota bacterium]
MGQQQFLLVIVGVIIVGLAIAIGISLFSAQSVSSNRDAMMNDLNHLAMVAYQFRISLRSMGGGEGDFSTFVIPTQMRVNNNGSYMVANAQPSTLTIHAISTTDASNSITVTIDSNGKLGNLTFGGDFQ